MYGKHFSQMYSGSMAGSGPVVFAVWGYAISNAGKDGIVELNKRIMAAAIGCTEKEIGEALDFLMAPDEESRTAIKEGRRLVKVGPFAYQIVTHAKYSKIRSEEERREYMREYMREYRKKEKEAERVNSDVNNVNNGKTQLAHIDVDIDIVERVPREGIPGGLTIDEKTRIDEFFKVAGLSGTILNVNAEKRHLYAQNMNFLMDDWERVQANVRPWIKSLDWKSPVTINNIASHLQAIADFKPNGNHSRRNKNSYDRNAGTANADKASDYSKIGRRRDL